MHIKKEIRNRVWNKYNKCCAYCGVELEYKQMQIDHIKPHWHNGTEEDCKRWGVTKGEHEETNFNPSCARCNRWKSTWTLEQFRNEINLQTQRLQRDSAAYRMALDYGIIKENNTPIKFWYESYTSKKAVRGK
jgi:5-methylcytosine-specific restriction endonuclease McrA